MSSPAFAIPAQSAPLDLIAQAPAAGAKDAKAAQQFEGMLMANLFQCMRKTVSHSSLFGDSGSAQSTYEYLMDQAVVNHAMTAGKGWGLAQRLEASWKAQAAPKKAQPTQ